MISKEGLRFIPELKLAGKVGAMSDSQFSSYVQMLNSFIDKFPATATKLQKNLDAKMYDTVVKDLTGIHETLTKLYADDIARECRKQIDALKGARPGDIDHDVLEAFIENFILKVSSLSIDIQMAAHKSATAAPPPQKAKQIYQQPTILAVDNAIMFLNTLKKLLSDAPYDVQCASSGAEALQFMESNRVDAFLLDVEMPDMDGYELARRIKQRGHKAPIVFITANSARDYVDKAVAVGAVGLLMKPLRINQLLSKLKEII